MFNVVRKDTGNIGQAPLQKTMEWALNHVSGKWIRVNVWQESQSFQYSATTLGKGLRRLVELGVLERTKEYTGIHYRIAENADLSETEEAEEIEFEIAPSEESSLINEDLVPYIENHVIEIKGERGLLDYDLALIYDVSVGALNQARKRNPTRFPDDFAFHLNKKEKEELSQSVIINFVERPGPLPWFYTREGCNQMSTVLNSEVAVERSKVIIRAFSDLERSAHGIETKQDGFKELIAGIATNIFTPVNQQLQAITNGIQSNAAKIDTTQKSLNQVKFNIERDKLEVQRKRYKQNLLEIGRIEKRLHGQEAQYWQYWEAHRRRYGFKASETPLTEAKTIFEDMKDRISKGIANGTYLRKVSGLKSEDQTFLAQVGLIS